MFAGLTSGLISALLTATTMLALYNYQFYSTPRFGQVVGSATENYASDLPSALYAAVLWFVPVGVLVFPWLVRLVGATGGPGLPRLLRLVFLAALIWFLIAKVLYVVLSPLAPSPPGAEHEDLISAALSGALFGVVYDLFLGRKSASRAP
jgi:hypothetical protein